MTEIGEISGLDASPDAARAALHGLYSWAWSGTTVGPELIEVSIKSPRGKWHAQHWDLDTLLAHETVKQLAWWSTQGREIYMGCVGLTERPVTSRRHPHPRGGAGLRGHAGALWLDVDCEAPGREGSDYFASIAAAVEVVDACLGPVLAEAALVVGSGWGVQYWIPLAEPVRGIEASRAVRALVGWVGETSAKQIDRVWDVTRVMRMPGTLNWRAGPEEEMARPTGVLRWPGEARRGRGRLTLPNVIDALGDQVSDVLEIPRLDPELDSGGPTGLLDALLQRYAPGAGLGADEDGGSSGDWAALGEVIGDLDRIADQVLTWGEVLEPHGWRCVSGGPVGGPDGSREQVWERPGKDEIGSGADHGERSAVVYADKPELLVVYSDSPACGFANGLRGSGRRGDAAGVGVVSKWRAWVDLAWAGDVQEARRHIREIAGGAEAVDTVAERLGTVWDAETNWVEDWGRRRELEALDSPFTTTMSGPTDP
jgi:hypothetical protein